MMHFYDELKRRKVTRVAVVYLVAAWVVLEVTSVVAPALNLPSWTTTLVLYLLAIGFPVALVLAWMFDITPDGIKMSEGYGRRKDDHTKPLGAMFLLAAMSIGGVWYFTQVVHWVMAPEWGGDGMMRTVIWLLNREWSLPLSRECLYLV